MIGFSVAGDIAGPLTVLCVGAHSDDIEIGCGATVLRLAALGAQIRFHWVVLSAAGSRGEEARKAAERFTSGAELNLHLAEFHDGYMSYNPGIKNYFEALKPKVQPDLIFTHRREDAHQDHRLVNQLTWNTYRNHAVFEYEIPKYDGDMGQPNMFSPVMKELAEKKVEILCDVFASQRSKSWFDREAFLGLMRIRGMESNSPSGLAEAFFARKVVMSFSREGASDVQHS
jgi:LmbE family N-acetylglucosaminyl deacetylase